MSQCKGTCGGWQYVTNRSENAMNRSIGGVCHNPDCCVNSLVGVLMRKSGRAAALLAAISLFSGVAVASPILIDSGAVQGTRTNDIVVYKGIPYAAPPLGDLRWREPQPVTPWEGVRLADTFAPACLQKGVSMPGETPPTVSEDCLYLNVWTPAGKPTGHLPVIVWIHGGGYSNGSASMPLYWGDRLARKGVIVVTIAYRLGPLGYLAHPELTQESAHHSSGNYGLMDQVAALEWIQRNIGAFGGDPKRVTLAGQSAGSMAVSMLMTSPRAKGLFQRAIGESGGLFEPLELAPGYWLANAEHDGQKYMASLGVASLQELRRIPAADLLGGTANAITHPVIEPYVLPLSPYDAFTSGRQNDVALLIGSNAAEARALADVTNVKASTFATDIEHTFGWLPVTIIEAYPHTTDVQARQARLDLERDLRFGWDMWAWARLQASTGKSAVYYYSFRQSPPFPVGSPYEGWGPSHFAELWYVFDHLDQVQWRWSHADRKLAEAMSDYWVNFARSGNPNGAGLPTWRAFAGENGRVQYLGDPIAAGDVPNIEHMRVFDAVYASVRGKPSAAQ
jgi:para-nitrobenzyl esterase